jgi:hypothetical protein
MVGISMIDKVEVRVPRHTPFTRAFASLMRDITGSKDDPFRPSRHYQRAGDLRIFDYSAILHTGCLHGDGNHKLELIDAGQMSYAGMVNEAERIFDTDSRRLGVMRVDLAADVQGVPVSWFLEYARARWKRWVSDIGPLEVSRMGNGGVQTLYFGKRPNCYRIYDKIAELRHQYHRLRRGEDRDAFPPFEEIYGYPESGLTLTRVERQIAAGRVPEQIGTFGKLRDLPSYNPFDKLELAVACPTALPQVQDCGVETFLAGMELRRRIEAEGIHRTRQWLNRCGARHAARLLEKFRDFIPNNGGLDATKLFEIYQDSVSRQIAA